MGDSSHKKKRNKSKQCSNYVVDYVSVEISDPKINVDNQVNDDRRPSKTSTAASAQTQPQDNPIQAEIEESKEDQEQSDDLFDKFCAKLNLNAIKPSKKK